jgi:hypothetical protein
MRNSLILAFMIAGVTLGLVSGCGDDKKKGGATSGTSLSERPEPAIDGGKTPPKSGGNAPTAQ